jgi:tetratricopeptide (TPR) repeat protein
MRAAVGRVVLACVGAPALVALLLALVELGYAVAGADPRRHYFLPAVDEAGRALLVESRDPPIANACFRVTRFTRRPPEGTRRIVCVGDSTCYGLPFDPPIPFYCWLEARLKMLLPERPTEVVNLASNGFAAEDVLDVLRDVDGAGADVLVVYAGHNEFLDRNLLPVLNPLAHAVRRTLARSRFGTDVMTAAHQAADVKVLTNSIHKERIRDEPFFTQAQIESAHDRFRDQVLEIVELAQARGALVVLVHPIADAADTATGVSFFAPATPPARRAEFLATLVELERDRLALEGVKHRAQPLDPARLAAAWAKLDLLEQIDASVVELHHQRGRLLRLEGKFEEARRECSTALENDGHPTRATAAIHAILDEVARARGALVVDPRPALDAAAAPDLPGQNGWFVDYVHPDIRGHELLADAILRALAHANALAPEAEWRFGHEPTSQEYLDRGGWKPSSVAATKSREALFLLVRAYYNSVTGDEVTAGARSIFRHSLEIDPKCAPAYLGLGMCAVLQKVPDEAIEQFERALAINPSELDQLWGQYRSQISVKALFDAAGLAMKDGRVVRSQ